MKNLLITSVLAIILLFSFPEINHAQSGSWNYNVTGQNIVLPDTSNGIWLGIYYGGSDDGVAKILWPFNFSVYDDNYTTSDSIFISTNGFIRFDGLIGTTAQTGQIPTNNTDYGQFLSYGGDTDGEVQSQMKYKVNGTAPNRVLSVFIPYSTYYSSGGYTANVYVSFYESNKSILVQYKNVVTGTSYHADELGINAGDNTYFNDLGYFPSNDTAYLFTPPTFGALDAGITHLYLSGNGVGQRTIATRLRCFGTDTLISGSIGWAVNSTVQNSYSWTGSLAQTQSDSIQIGSFNFSQAGIYSIKAWTINPNGGIDSNKSNDTATLIINILPYYSLPVYENFESGFTKFGNATGNTTDFTVSNSYFNTGTKCAHNSHTNTNVNILHETGLMDLSSSAQPWFEFYHIAKTEGNWDHCFVEISTDGGANYTPLPDSVYLGNSLDYSYKGYFHEDSYTLWGTTDTTPDNATWWVYEKFDLKDYKVNNVRLRFRLVADGSTNRQGWFIDDIKIYQPIPIDLGADMTLCANQDTTFDIGLGFDSILWSTGDTTQTITVDTSGYGTGMQTIWVTALDTNGCTSTDTINITFTLCTGIESTVESYVKVFPIPTNDIIIIQFFNFKTKNISIYNLNGKIIETINDPVNDEYKIDFKALDKGIYFIRFIGNEKSLTKKIIVN